MKFDVKRICPKVYKDSDLVMVKITSDVTTGSSKKLHPVFKGPFKVKVVLPNDRYVLEDLRTKKGSQISVIAVDKMKPWVVLNDPEDLPFDEDGLNDNLLSK